MSRNPITDEVDLGGPPSGIPGGASQVITARLDIVPATPSETDGCVLRAGIEATPLATAVLTDMKFVSIYTTSPATSGTVRGIYNALTLTGAGGGGESLRSRTILKAGIETAHGAHLGLTLDSIAGYVTGLGVAVRATLELPSAALHAAGTYAALMAEVYSNGTASDPAAVTDFAFLRVVNGGDATGAAHVEDVACFVSFVGGTAGTGNMIGAAVNEPSWAGKTRLIRCRLPAGGLAYLVAVEI